MKDKIEKLIQSYRGNIKNYSNCSCRSSCNCDEMERYTNAAFRTVIEDLENLIQPPRCIRCGDTSVSMDKFFSSDRRKVYLCMSCIKGGKVYEEK